MILLAISSQEMGGWVALAIVVFTVVVLTICARKS
jgi:hypothetical protein